MDRLGESAAPSRFLTFRVADRLYALPAEDVAEIIVMPPVARLPLAPASLLGVANSRGSVIPVVSLRAMLGLAPMADRVHETARAIVLGGSGEQVVLAVDAVDSLVSLDEERVTAAAQAELAAEPGETVRGAFDDGTGKRVAKILDMPALLAAAFPRRRKSPKPSGAAAKSTRAVQSEADQSLLVVFTVAGQEYALPLTAVQEIVPLPDAVTVAPRAEAVLMGVAPYRDGLLPLHSLRGLLGFSVETAPADGAKVLVTKLAGSLIGLVADTVRTIVRANAELIEAAPPMLAARTGGEARIESIYRGDNGTRLISVLAPELLFREDVMRRVGESPARAPHPAADATRANTGQTIQFLVFRLGDEEFGLPIGAVDEVTRVPDKVTRLPRTPAFLEGVINLRGEVLPVIDQRKRFGMPLLDGAEGQRLVVVRTARHRAGLIVDSVRQVLRADIASIEPTPELSTGAHQVVSGVLNTGPDSRMVLLLDPDALLSQAEHEVLDTFDADPAEAGRDRS